MLSAAFIHLIVAVGPELSRNVGYQTRRPLPRGSPPPEPAPANTHTRDFQGRVLWANADVSFVPLVNPANKIRAAQGWEQLREARGRAPLPTGALLGTPGVGKTQGHPERLSASFCRTVAAAGGSGGLGSALRLLCGSLSARLPSVVPFPAVAA